MSLSRPICGDGPWQSPFAGCAQALIVADLTKGTGRFNLAQGFVGTLAGIGASVSTTLFSLVVGTFGGAVGFVSIAGVALSTVLIVWLLMPETNPSKKTPTALGGNRYGSVSNWRADIGYRSRIFS
jgi:hypothetical protein